MNWLVSVTNKTITQGCRVPLTLTAMFYVFPHPLWRRVPSFLYNLLCIGDVTRVRVYAAAPRRSPLLPPPPILGLLMAILGQFYDVEGNISFPRPSLIRNSVDYDRSAKWNIDRKVVHNHGGILSVGVFRSWIRLHQSSNTFNDTFLLPTLDH